MERHARRPRPESGPASEPARSGPHGDQDDTGGSFTIRVGVDLASIDAVRASVDRFGDRYTRRCYTEQEIQASRGAPEVMAASLAARFAAKEATFKALAAGQQAFAWHSAEVRRRPEGGCTVALHGALAELAARDRVSELTVSLTHEGAMAAAVVVAVCQPPQGPEADRPNGRQFSRSRGPERED